MSLFCVLQLMVVKYSNPQVLYKNGWWEYNEGTIQRRDPI